MPAAQITSHPTLNELLRGLTDAPDLPVSGIAADSRLLRENQVFLACQGVSSHGLDYLEQVLDAGAVAIVWDHPSRDSVEAPVPTIRLHGLQSHLGEIANRWFDSPSRALNVTGVTGTNGKTTTAYLIQQCWQKLQQPCGYIGTLGAGVTDFSAGYSMTTPPCIELHQQLAEFRDQGAQHAAIEVSSHAITQSRVDGVHFDAAIFTNLSRDHIDYHGGMRNYFEAKASLFLDFEVKHRIVSLDTEFGSELADRCGGGVVTVSTRKNRVAKDQPFVFITAIVAKPAGSDISVASSWGDAEIFLPLPGDFNVANAAQALALLLCREVPFEAACEALQRLSAPPGRMQSVSVVSPTELPAVYVDYSHTPASLEAALEALRGHCNGKLWCVFGCGGDRDKGKRPMMGKVAQRLADVAVVTSDNPRTEDPASIIADVLKGMRAGTSAIADRNEAIAYAIQSAADDDTILIAGKGHEHYQIIGTEHLRFSDTDRAAEHLEVRARRETDQT